MKNIDVEHKLQQLIDTLVKSVAGIMSLILLRKRDKKQSRLS
jgi:hypothetical protein